jgi:hypothetical protein
VKRGFVVPALLVLAVGFAAAPAVADVPENYRAHLTGAGEIPAVDTDAQGEATFQLSADGTALDFRLIVANIENVVQAHIHCGGPDVNGPVVVFLFGPEPDGVTHNGVLSTGTATSADVIPVPDSAVCPGGVADMDDVLEKIRTGEAYANVHTTVNPGGEIRGQIG